MKRTFSTVILLAAAFGVLTGCYYQYTNSRVLPNI